MSERSRRTIRIVILLAAAFVAGGGSAEVALRTHRAMERARAEREIGSAGQLVALELTDRHGAVFARPRVIAPDGKRTELVLHDPAHPDEVRLAFRVEAVRAPSGEIALDYALWVPDRAIAAKGKLSLSPGVEQKIRLGGGAVVATWLAVPVPSAAFDAFLEDEATRRADPEAT
jgi:hypothetical protein